MSSAPFVAPTGVTAILRLASKPKHGSFTRHLVLRGHSRRSKTLNLPIAFEPHTGKPPYTFIGSFPEGLSALEKASTVNYRNYWDNLFLVNFGGSTGLELRSLTIKLQYPGPPDVAAQCFRLISLVDCSIAATLDSGYSAISLARAQRTTQWRWAKRILRGYNRLKMPGFDAHPAVFSALRDLGKSGSDGKRKDAYGRNPKYGIEHSALCSEFVSWYYHETAVELGERDAFRNILSTKDLKEIFEARGTAHPYDHDKRCFVNSQTGLTYNPEPGDFLERQSSTGAAEHSMMFLAWDSGIQRAVVINGPRPVTLRNVRVQDWATHATTPKRFWVGAVRPTFRFPADRGRQVR